MKNTDSLWLDVWSKEKYPPIKKLTTKDIEDKLFAMDASCAYSMGSYFTEGMKILDYGCGPTRFCNFMAQRIQNFTYYGIEPSSNYGKSCISDALNSYKDDERIKLGFIGDNIESEAIDSVDVVLLLSIFTHTTIEETESILWKLYPVIERGGIIVFTMILRDKYETIGPGAYNIGDTYAVTYNTTEQVNMLAEKFNCSMTLKDTWLHVNTWLHNIYEMKINEKYFNAD
jgi:SAM-dependent methyltransferase